MSRLLLALVLSIALVSPAAAGDADTPELTDPCGDRELGEAGYDVPEADICAAWLDAAVVDGAVALTMTTRTLIAPIDGERLHTFAFTSDDCRWTVTIDDAVASPRRTAVVGEWVVAFPYSWDVGLRVACGARSVPRLGLVPGCTTTEYDRRVDIELPADAAQVDGTDVAVTVDMAALGQQAAELGGDLLVPGDVLEDIRVTAHRTPSSVLPTGGAVCADGTCTGDELSDVASGGPYAIPADEAAS